MTTNSLAVRVPGNVYGLAAVCLWSIAPSLIRILAEQFGPVGGAALMYSVATLFLIIFLGWKPLKSFPKSYLLIVGALFVAYEIALSMALGFAQTRSQSVEMTLLNYLWPCMTALLAVLMKQQRASLWLVPGLIISFTGVASILGGSDGLSISSILENAGSNPLSYSLALSCAFTWAFYSCLSKKLSNGTNAIIPFFGLTAITLWIKFIIGGYTIPTPSADGLMILGATSVFMALGYAAWNKALQTGDLLLLSAISYATPVLSVAFSSLILGLTLGLNFWHGTLMVTVGSLLCWASTLKR